MGANLRGTIKFFQVDRGFGFIRPEDGGPDVFVPISALASAGTLQEGDKVEYEFGTDRKSGRPKAENVRVVV